MSENSNDTLIKAPKRGPGRPWQPGVSPNPGGRPKALISARNACRELGDETLALLVDLMRNSGDERVRVQCACRIRDEAYGKPTTSDIVQKEDARTETDASHMTDAELLQEAINRAKAATS